MIKLMRWMIFIALYANMSAADAAQCAYSKSSRHDKNINEEQANRKLATFYPSQKSEKPDNKSEGVVKETKEKRDR